MGNTRQGSLYFTVLIEVSLAQLLPCADVAVGRQSLANVAWATACAGCLRVELLRPLQARALELADRFNERELKQFYQAELTLRLEYPDSCALLSAHCLFALEPAEYVRFKGWPATILLHERPLHGVPPSQLCIEVTRSAGSCYS